MQMAIHNTRYTCWYVKKYAYCLLLVQLIEAEKHHWRKSPCEAASICVDAYVCEMICAYVCIYVCMRAGMHQ
jgi:hypothetical protein